MPRLPLQASASATFTASGTGTVARLTIGPTIYGTEWDVKRVVVSTNSPQVLGQSECRVYLNVESPTALLDGTYSGDMDTNETSIHLMASDKLVVIWTGGDIGSIATVFVSGTYETGRR